VLAMTWAVRLVHKMRPTAGSNATVPSLPSLAQPLVAYYFPPIINFAASGRDSCLSNLTYTHQQLSLQTPYPGNNCISSQFPALSENKPSPIPRSPQRLDQEEFLPSPTQANAQPSRHISRCAISGNRRLRATRHCRAKLARASRQAQPPRRRLQQVRPPSHEQRVALVAGYQMKTTSILATGQLGGKLALSPIPTLHAKNAMLRGE